MSTEKRHKKDRHELLMQARIERIFVPGVWKCDKCAFVLTRTSISATTGDFGTTSADREDSEPCPNDGQEMRRVSWQERAKELYDTIEEFFKEPSKFHPYAKLEAELSALYHDFERQHEEFRRELEVYGLQRQQLEATNKYYLDVITGVKALEPPPPIIIDNMDKVAKLEAERSGTACADSDPRHLPRGTVAVRSDIRDYRGGVIVSGYLPDGCTQEDCDRAAGGYDEGYYCDWCEERVDDEHECPGRDLDEQTDDMGFPSPGSWS